MPVAVVAADSHSPLHICIENHICMYVPVCMCNMPLLFVVILATPRIRWDDMVMGYNGEMDVFAHIIIGVDAFGKGMKI